MIKAVLFDFDGVLTLDETGSQSICNYISEVTGLDKELLKSEYRKYNPSLLTGKLKHEDIWHKLCDGIGCNLSIDILYDSFINTPINTEILEVAKRVKSKGFKVGLVTDNKIDRINSIVKHYNWNALFDGVSISAEVGSGKDNNLIFTCIFEKLKVNPEECIFIDNKEKNLLVPQRLGVSTILFDYNKNDSNYLINKLCDLGIKI